jgi:hypothetical protein
MEKERWCFFVEFSREDHPAKTPLAGANIRVSDILRQKTEGYPVGNDLISLKIFSG